LDEAPFGAAFAQQLPSKMGQTHVDHYLRPLLARIEQGEIDPSFVISRRFNLTEAPNTYRFSLREKDECTKVVLKY